MPEGSTKVGQRRAVLCSVVRSSVKLARRQSTLYCVLLASDLDGDNYDDRIVDRIERRHVQSVITVKSATVTRCCLPRLNSSLTTGQLRCVISTQISA